MKANSCYFLLLGFILLTNDTLGRPIWFESFTTAEKGYWGDEDGETVHRDLEGIGRWLLDVGDCVFTSADDYVRTVGTSGGRLEARDCDGEAVWTSEWITISSYDSIAVSMLLKETGSGKTEASKYMQAFYRLDGGAPLLLAENGSVAGNWGEALAYQGGLQGDSLQLLVRMKTNYASDKLILDEVLVELLEPEAQAENLAEAGDVLVNELLFNPRGDAPDFVELVNVSGKELRLDHLFLASRTDEGELKQVQRLATWAEYFYPNSYLALCEQVDTLLELYPTACTENLWPCELPTFNNDDGVVVLLNDSLDVIDEFYYAAQMHKALLQDENGVSLERKSLFAASNDRENWTSASSLAGFATPGCPNSMRQEEDRATTELYFDPDVISPNNDGYRDFTTIRIQLPQPDWLVNIRLFDASGFLLEQTLKNATVGADFNFPWQGNLQNGEALPNGIYVFYIELNNLNGERKVFRKTCTIVNRLM